MYYRLDQAQVQKAVLFKHRYKPEALRVIRIIVLSLGILAVILYFLVVGVSYQVSVPFVETSLDMSFSLNSTIPGDFNLYLGLFLLLFPTGLTLLFFEIYFKYHLKHSSPKDPENIAEYLRFDAAMVMDRAARIAYLNGRDAIGTGEILEALSLYDPAKHLFVRLSLHPDRIRESIKSNTPTKKKFTSLIFSKQPKKLSSSAQKVMEEAYEYQSRHDHPAIDIADFLPALFEADDAFQKVMVKNNVDKRDLHTLAGWHEKIVSAHEKRERFWTLNNLLKTRPIGADWVYGYPRMLEQFSRDLTAPFSETQIDFELVDREESGNRLEEVLLRQTKQNALLVSDPGTGKRSIVFGLAQDVARGDAPKGLRYKRVLEVDLGAVLSSASDPAIVQNNLNTILQEASEVGNAILFIEHFHNYVSKQEALGGEDITQIILPYLERSNIQIIATTDPVSFHKFMGDRQDILGAFERIDIEELEREDVMRVLEISASQLEAQKKVFFTYNALKALYEDARKYIQGTPFPEKALSAMDEVVSYLRSEGNEIIEEEDVHAVMERKTSIPMGEIKEEEKESLINLDEIMHKQIVDQEAAVRTVAQTMQRLRAGLTRENKPAGVFLFVGPTGVGKTLTAKVLAEVQFGSKENMVRIDMSEYQTQDSVKRLLGSGEDENTGELIAAVKDNPHSVLLLDEFEKAHKEILNVFLRIFDEGSMEDVFGRRVSFEQNIIIATSNAGAKDIRNMVKQGRDPSEEKENLVNLFIETGEFAPELLNRFDEVVIFHPLGSREITKIAEILLGELQERLRDKGYYYKPTKEVVEYISKIGFDPQFGARPMSRAIQDTVESYIAQKILEDEIKKGEEFTVSVDNIKNFTQ